MRTLAAAMAGCAGAAGCARGAVGSAAAVERPAPTPPAGAVAIDARPITDYGYHNETSIAIDPRDPSNLVVAYQVPATVAATFDGGARWQAQPLPGTDGFELSGDPSVLFDAAGHAYVLYIAFDRPEDYDTLGRKAHRNGIWVNRSDDGGRTWRSAPTPVVAWPERAGIPFEDKPMMAAGPDGALYVAWTQFRRHESGIRFSRSTDGGRSFSAPIEIGDRVGSPKDSAWAAEGTDVAVGPDGTVYVAWADSIGIWLDRSTDGGRSFGRDRLVTRIPGSTFDIPGVARANGFPGLEIDPRRGRLYVAWVDRRSGSALLWLAASDDGGSTWSAPRTVSPPPEGVREEQFFAWMAVDSTNGAVVTGFYQVTPDSALRYELAWSRDGGRSFTRRHWGAGPFRGNGEFLGDYTGVAALGGVAWAAWTETHPSTTETKEDARESEREREAERVHTAAHASRVVVGRAELSRRP